MNSSPTHSQFTDHLMHTAHKNGKQEPHRVKSFDLLQERSQKGDSGCASEKLGVPHLLSDECKKKKKKHAYWVLIS